jgi:hypothetical protein
MTNLLKFEPHPETSADVIYPASKLHVMENRENGNNPFLGSDGIKAETPDSIYPV